MMQQESTINRPKKVLHVVNISFVLPYYIGDQFDFFPGKGIHFFVVCQSDPFLFSYAEEKKFTAKALNIVREINIIEDIKAVYQLCRFIKKEKIDIVVGHTPKGGLISMIASFLAGVKKRVYFRHGIMYETSKGIKRRILKSIEKLTGNLSTKVVCVSNSVLEFSQAENLSYAKCSILNKGTCNGIDVIGKFNPALTDTRLQEELKHKYGILPGDKVVGYVGRLVNDKGVNELVGAWKVLEKKYPNLKLLLVGPYESRDALGPETKEVIEQTKSIIHTGLIKDIMPYYGLMDMFILPSYREGLPTVVLEASAMELPVITTRSTGCKDSIIEGSTGIFAMIAPLDIAEKISYYVDNEHVAARHGKAGRAFVLENFEQHRIWKEIEENVYSL